MEDTGKVIGPSWQFKPEDQPPPAPQPTDQPAIDAVSWTASEFVAHQKNAGWYLLIPVAAVAVAAAVFVFTKDKISTAMVAIVGIVLAVFGARKPRTLSYKVDSSGISIGRRVYGWDMFKSFSIIEEGAIASIYLTPLKRFMPAMTVYYAPADEDKILNVIGDYLPHEQRQPDLVDKLMHKIRF